jgi:hypothetical protein
LKEFRLRVAGLTFRVKSAGEGPDLGVAKASRPFLVDTGGEPDVTLDVRWGDLSGEREGELLFDSGGVWRLHREDGSLVFRFRSANLGGVPYLSCRMAPGVRQGEIVFHRPYFQDGEAVDALQYPLDEVLMIHLLGQGLGVELHACGVIDGEGRGYLFSGQSGDGKSTMARLWQERPGTVILSDDRIVVRREEGHFVMYGTPWHGDAELAASRWGTVDAIFILERGLENSLRSVSVPDAIADLMARSFVPFHDPEAVDRTLGIVGELSHTVSTARLAFVPDNAVCEYLAPSRSAG